MRRSDPRKKQQEVAPRVKVTPKFKTLKTVQVSKGLWIQIPQDKNPTKAVKDFMNRTGGAHNGARPVYVGLKGI